ncbi:MAG TPA: DUF2127 domain-containing protein [Burkholderiales bacterium]|nr:DUF2127 domain-containing protein [Burkholderiales bacterium]
MTGSAGALQGTLRAVAVLEAAKGLLVLATGFGLLSLVHRDVQGLAERLVRHAHLNPAAHYPRIFLELASGATQARLMVLAAGAVAYALMRVVEAYGLWRARGWAEWFAALSGSIYVPFELAGIARHPNWLGVILLLVNVLVVAVMLLALYARKRT